MSTIFHMLASAEVPSAQVPSTQVPSTLAQALVRVINLLDFKTLL